MTFEKYVKIMQVIIVKVVIQQRLRMQRRVRQI
jgi:hypothetical protein